MPISTIAVYKNGLLEPVHKLGLEENERVRITITQEEGTRPTPQESAERGPEDYFEPFTENGRTITEMAACTRRRLAALDDDLERADFPPHI